MSQRPGLRVRQKALYRVPQCGVEAVWKFMEVVVTDVWIWPGVAACDQTSGPMRNGSDPVKERGKAVFALKREWMGIEPTRPLFSALTGFEVQRRSVPKPFPQRAYEP